MLRRFRKFVWPHRERLLSLVMLPAFFVASLPHPACICGDGHRELFCTPGHCRACLRHATSTADGGHSCCQGHASELVQSCCGTKHDDQTPTGGTSNSGLTAIQGCCCKGIVEVAGPATVSKKSEFAAPGTVVANTQSSAAYVSVSELWPLFEQFNDSTPPPVDAVIVYLHLTI